ncbi:MAG: phosphopantothenoylcysteine decarboxylase, partial [Elusimicrobia bacterium]|nr:phosphopantothenoylcysteine decarboxylase [Elusimicrobiota bacterium]
MITILITLGSTREYLDPVRFISNASSGKMGKSLIDEALKRNCKVIAIKGPCSVEIKQNKNCKVIDIISARDMLAAVKKNLKNTDIFIGAAAVSDYRPKTISKNKIKKQDIKNNEVFTLQLV